MGLELLINVRSGRDDTEMKSKGDIICVKLQGSPWSANERKMYAVARITDDGISGITNLGLKGHLHRVQLRLEAQLAAGEPHPVEVYPTAVDIEKGTEGEEDYEMREGRTSRWFVNISLLPLPVRNSWNNLTEVSEIELFTAARINNVFKTRSIPVMQTGERSRNREDD